MLLVFQQNKTIQQQSKQTAQPFLFLSFLPLFTLLGQDPGCLLQLSHAPCPLLAVCLLPQSPHLEQ